MQATALSLIHIFFLQRDLRIHTHDGVADHKLESDKAKNAHDERDDENTLAPQIVAGIVNQHRQNNRSRNSTCLLYTSRCV